MGIEEALSAAKAIDLSQLEGRNKAEPLYNAIITEYDSTCTSVEDRRSLAVAYNNRGQIKYMRVDFNEAIEDYTRAIALDSQLSYAYYNRGQIHYRLARYEQGASDFERSLELQPDFADARRYLGQARVNIDLKKRGLNSSYS